MELQTLKRKIYEVRNQSVMFDFDLAELYETETRSLKQAVNRNTDRFPEDFMFQLSKQEWNEVITNCDNLPLTAKFSPSRPFAFTEQGVAMLSSVLKSKKAIAVNIGIMRAFVLIRQHALTYLDLTDKLNALELKYNQRFQDINDAISFLLNKQNAEEEQKNRTRLGYQIKNS